ncbi:hypothetical protein ABEB36_008091 [Hypothenemus hampei]|uniref:RRM domain-containing protein n=1 Tax=Hypothenemus hampei TaxID=57062 RepID=A0ABD1EMU9_HYPHA
MLQKQVRLMRKLKKVINKSMKKLKRKQGKNDTVDSKDTNVTNDDDESKNGTETSEIDVNISESIVAEMSCDNQSTEITTEETSEIIITEHKASEPSNIDDNSRDLTQACTDTFQEDETNKPEQSKENNNIKTEEIANENVNQNNKTDISANVNEVKKEQQETKKKITLKRPEITHTSPINEETQETGQKETWESVYEMKEIPSEGKGYRRKITLKRSTIDDSTVKEHKEISSLEKSNSLQETQVSSNDNIIIHEKPRKTKSTTDKISSDNEEKPQKTKKPTKVVKLVRKLPEELPEKCEEDTAKKLKWSHSEISSLLNVPSVSLMKLKEVCPEIDFLNEEDVNLEVTPEKRSPEKKRKSFKELEDEEMENIEAELNAEPEESESKENIIALNRKISIVDDTASKLNPPPSPAKNPKSEILFVTNLVRPFTVKQLKELLERTGKIQEDGFWTDKIKSKCYVCYENAEEAEATRNALHGIHWPIGNGKKLQIDFATMEDMEKAKNPPVVPLPKAKSIEKENNPEVQEEKLNERESRSSKREWDIGTLEVRKRSRSRERRHSRRSFTPEGHHKRRHEEPVEQKAMDDLFLKTKATPSIYWQPLSPEEIAHKQQQRQARLEENKRRLEEIRSSTRDRRDRSFRRR